MFGELLTKLGAAYNEVARDKNYAAAARIVVCDVACGLLEPTPVHAAASAGFDEPSAAACEAKVLEIQTEVKKAGVQAGGTIAVLAIELLVTNLPTILKFIRDKRAGR